MNRFRLVLSLLAIIGFCSSYSPYTECFLAPADIRDHREIRLIAEHDRNRTRIAKNKHTTDTEKAAALEAENREFTAKMVELTHLKVTEQPRPKCTNRCPYFFRCREQN